MLAAINSKRFRPSYTYVESCPLRSIGGRDLGLCVAARLLVRNVLREERRKLGNESSMLFLSLDYLLSWREK